MADTPFVYDEVAYPTPILSSQTPDQMRAAALMQGFDGPDPATASVLEIGCGNGYNLIGAAAVAPGSHCVGFDLSASAIAMGNTLVAAAGLTNIDLVHGDIMTWPRDGEQFDYIVCHGVYSWVPEPVRVALMELCGKVLKPGGIAYMGYDSLPGSAAKQAINRFLRANVSDIADLVERIDTAVALISILARHQRDGSRLKAQLDHLVKDAPGYPRAYFFHDWLAEFYMPMSIEDFSARAEAAGLRFAGDSALHDLYSGDLDSEAQSVLRAAGDDRAKRNVVLDMMRGTHMFRGDMLVRADAPPARVDDPLKRLGYAFMGERTEVTESGRPAVRFGKGERVFITAVDPEQQAVMNTLIAVAPTELSYSELLERSGVAEKRLLEILQKVVVMGLLDTHASAPIFTLTPGERPVVGPLTRAMIQHEESAISLRHSKFVSEQAPTRLMLTLCDGTRTREDIAAEMSVHFGQPVPVERVAAAVTEFARERLFLA